MQFGIRNLLLLTVGVAVMCAMFVFVRSDYYFERRKTESVLATIQGISNIKLHSYIDITEEINSSSFSVTGQPSSIVVLGRLTRYEVEGQFSVFRIGKWKFRNSGRNHGGNYVAATGEPVESNYFGYHIALGRNSPYQELFPFEINTLQDIVDHYQELVDLLETWPRENEPGEVTLEDGTTQYFYVVEEKSMSP